MSAMVPNKHGGARPKRRPDDRRGGARRGAGAPVRRLQLDKDTAQKLRALCDGKSPLEIVSALIHQAYEKRIGSEP